MINLLRLEAGAGSFWPKDWPAGIGLVARLAGERIEQLFPFHEDEGIDAPFLRAAKGLARDQLGVSPDAPGWPSASGDGDGDGAVLGILALAISHDPAVLEQASDFAMNYEYAKSEGKPFLFDPVAACPPGAPAAARAEPASAPETVADAAAGLMPLADLWLLRGVSLQAVDGREDVIAVQIPCGEGVCAVATTETFLAPEGGFFSLRVTGTGPLPGTALVSRRVLDFLPEVDLPAQVRAIRRGDLLEITPVQAADDDADADHLPERPAPGSRRAIAPLMLAAVILLTGAASASLHLGLPDLARNWVSELRMKTGPVEAIDSLRSELFSTPPGEAR